MSNELKPESRSKIEEMHTIIDVHFAEIGCYAREDDHFNRFCPLMRFDEAKIHESIRAEKYIPKLLRRGLAEMDKLMQNPKCMNIEAYEKTFALMKEVHLIETGHKWSAVG